MNWYAIRHKGLRDWLASPGLYRAHRHGAEFSRREAFKVALYASAIRTAVLSDREAGR